MPDDFDYSQPRQSVQAQRETTGTGTPIITIFLIVLSVIITLAYWTPPGAVGGMWYKLGNFGGQTSYQIWAGHYWGLFTSVFMHINVIHILFNMQWMWQLGKRAEAELHPITYVLFLVAAAGISSCVQILVSGDTGIGMSGVVYALFGLMWAGRGRFRSWQEIATRQNLELMLGWGVLCIVATQLNWMQIGNGAHGGGLIFGLSIGWLFVAPRRQPVWAIPLALLGVACVVSLTWVPWTHEWNFFQGNRAFDRGDYATAITYYQRSLKQGGSPADNADNWDNISSAWHNIGYDAERRHDEATEAHAEAEEKAAESKGQAAKAAAPAKAP